MIWFLIVQAALGWSADSQNLCPERPVIVRVKAENADQVKHRFELKSTLPYHVDKKVNGDEAELRIKYRCPVIGDQFAPPNEAALLMQVTKELLPERKKLGVKSIKLEGH